jgi:hypothetical protein
MGTVPGALLRAGVVGNVKVGRSVVSFALPGEPRGSWSVLFRRDCKVSWSLPASPWTGEARPDEARRFNLSSAGGCSGRTGRSSWGVGVTCLADEGRMGTSRGGELDVRMRCRPVFDGRTCSFGLSVFPARFRLRRSVDQPEPGPGRHRAERGAFRGPARQATPWGPGLVLRRPQAMRGRHTEVSRHHPCAGLFSAPFEREVQADPDLGSVHGCRMGLSAGCGWVVPMPQDRMTS